MKTNYRSNHNCASDGEKHYVSYNWKDTEIYGSVTTAIVIGQMQRFYILDGNHYEQLQGKTFEECIKYYQDNQKLINKRSNKYSLEDATKVIEEYATFKKEKGYE